MRTSGSPWAAVFLCSIGCGSSGASPGAPPSSSALETPPSVATEPPATAAPSSSPPQDPPVASSTVPAPHGRPPLEDTCATNADCDAIMPGIPGSDVCCPGCQWQPANKSSLARFRADCTASPPASCPPLGCAVANQHAECRGGHCVMVQTRP